jgi:hypothetical protein
MKAMMFRNLLRGVVALEVLLAGGPVLAHHAFTAEFDSDKPVNLEGAVTQVEWTNPHSWIYIEVKKPDGAKEDWAIEAGSPNTLYRRGFTKQLLPVGKVIKVTGFKAKDGSNRANGRDLLLPDGRSLFLGSPNTGAPEKEPR